ncbi:hypothetical protein AB0I28_09665 [Phytomonospora sp. NPDC050363]|uniref:hypothetical protein n=1 Tax=Phytomonospora sp. NPDC050363 TaxID=3155642 RepID=UPI0033D8DBAE
MYESTFGDDYATAAVMLIEGHGMWLRRSEFLDCINADWEDDAMSVTVNWIGLGRVTSSDAADEVEVLHLAASMASPDVHVSIAWALPRLIPATGYQVLASLAYAAGHALVLGGDQS